MELDIFDYLKQYQGFYFDCIPNPGNAGDPLIAAETYQVFDKLGLTYRVVDRHRFDHKGKVVVSSGGENLGLMTNVSAQFLERIYDTAAKVIILPHTIKSVLSFCKRACL